MEATADWYKGIENEVGSLKGQMSEYDYKLYELDLLLRVAKQVATLSSGCEYCQGHRNDISKLVADLKNLPEITHEEVADYGRTFRSIMKHLEKNHGDPMKSSKSKGCLIGAIGCIVSPILFIVGIFLSIYPQSFWEGTPDGPIFWFFTLLSIAVLIIGFSYLLKKR